MNLSKRQQEIRNENRATAGLPVLHCRGRAEAHWVPDVFDDNGLVVPGHYICLEMRA